LPGITVSNFTYTFSGSSRLLGTARMFKTGLGDVTFNGSSENSVQVSQGTLFGSGTVGAVSVASGAALSYSGTINGGLTCAGAATNAGSVNGPLTLQTGGVLENPGNTTGALTLNNDTYVSNSGRMNAVGSVVVPTNSTLINNGTIEGVRVDINTGGTVKGIGTFEVSNRVQALARASGLGLIRIE